MNKKKFVKVMALIIQIVFFVMFKLDKKKLELYDIYINLIMPFISIISFFISLRYVNEDFEDNGINGDGTVVDENNDNDIGIDNNNTAVGNQVSGEINNRRIRQINTSEITFDNQNSGQPNEQHHLDQGQGREDICNNYIENN